MNVARQITDISFKYPQKLSVICPKKGNKSYSSYNFHDLEVRINQFSNQLEHLGIKKKDKVLVFIKPNLDFAAIVFSLFKIEAVAVFIDPGMGKNKLLAAIEESEANVLIGISKVHILRRVFKKSFKNIKLFLTNSKSSFFAKSIYKNIDKVSHIYSDNETASSELAALLYTSGGTGKPKGVLYTHDIFIKQTQKLKNEFNLTHNDVDLAGFPLFAMFTLSMGMSSVIPYMDPARPAMANPKELVKNIKDHNVTFVAGSPAIWSRMVEMCIDKNIRLDSVKYFVMFGAPISYSTHEKFSKILSNGSTYTPYGATECLPVSNISGKEILGNWTQDELVGKGICVGRALENVEVKVIKISEGAVEAQDIRECKEFEIGEIIVSSSTVTSGYFNLENKTALSKIYDKDKLWHRMGDTGYFDSESRLWFTGRVAHSFTIGFNKYFPIPIEQFFLSIKTITKVAFVKVKEHQTALIVEGDKSSLVEIKDTIYKNSLKVDHILFHPSFPVDIRHNIKVDRAALAKWALKKVKDNK